MTVGWLLSMLVALTDTSIAATIPAGGGTIALPGVAQVAFPAGSFVASQRVELRISRSAEIRAVFEETVAVHPIARAEWEVTIRTGNACPVRPVKVELHVPSSLKPPSGHTPTVYALTLQSGGEDMLDGFERVRASRYDKRTRKVTADLPAEAFTAERQADRACEAVLVVGTAPLT